MRETGLSFVVAAGVEGCRSISWSTASVGPLMKAPVANAGHYERSKTVLLSSRALNQPIIPRKLLFLLLRWEVWRGASVLHLYGKLQLVSLASPEALRFAFLFLMSGFSHFRNF